MYSLCFLYSFCNFLDQNVQSVFFVSILYLFCMKIVQSVLAYWELKLSTSSQVSELRQACQKAKVKHFFCLHGTIMFPHSNFPGSSDMFIRPHTIQSIFGFFENK